jgi:phage terminase large subunit GpA-like protein
MTRLDRIADTALDILKPPPCLTISEWAETNLVLSPEDSSERGRYRSDRAPYQREIMDAIGDPAIEGVVVMSSAQVGKTLIAKAVIGYYIDQDPSPILLVMPTLETAQSFSRDRLAPMVRDTECLRGKVASPKARDSGNTVLRKTFPGGHLTIVGANSAAGLASRPIRILICDEVDRYPPSAGTEGDPVNLGRARLKTFWNRREALFSTPGDEDTSRIAPAYEASDQRRFFVKCGVCGHAQTLKWSGVNWTGDDPDTARYACENCGSLWGDAERIEALQTGEWIAAFPERRIAGFHLNEIYSPFRKLSEMVADFLAAKGRPETLRTWINTSLGETWKQQDEGDKIEAHELADRIEPYTLPPVGVLLITLTIDVQDDRLECEFVGWGDGEECWGIEHVVLRGDIGSAALWQRASDELARTFHREDGAVLTVAACAVDSGGHYTAKVYEWARKHRGRVYAMKGAGGPGRALVEVSQRPLRDHGIRLYIVGTDAAKELFLMSRLKIATPGPGYCHWPEDCGYPGDYFEQLTSERRIITYRVGRPVHRWVLNKGDRNEALDLRVYALVLIALLKPQWPALAQRVSPNAVTAAPVQRQPLRTIRSNYLMRTRP